MQYAHFFYSVRMVFLYCYYLHVRNNNVGVNEREPTFFRMSSDMFDDRNISVALRTGTLPVFSISQHANKSEKYRDSSSVMFTSSMFCTWKFVCVQINNSFTCDFNAICVYVFLLICSNRTTPQFHLHLHYKCLNSSKHLTDLVENTRKNSRFTSLFHHA